MVKIKQSQSGFTIIELLISITIFSMILLLCAAAMIYIGRMYYKGSIVTKTQETSREIMDNVIQAVQFSSSQKLGVHTGDNISGTYCFGNTRYTYNTARTTDDGYVLWRDSVFGADADNCITTDQSSGVEMAGKNMRLAKFVILDSGTSVDIDLLLAYGDDLNLFIDSSPDKGCISVDIGGQFCATSVGKTIVSKRLR